MPNPLVSVITPVGPRHSQHALTAIASVKWQSTAAVCEHILACDGGANVPEVDGAIVLPSDGECRGPAHARNRALAHARGQFILPLDADDYLLPRSVEHLLREYSRGTHGYVYGDSYTEEPWHRVDQFRGHANATIDEARQKIWFHRSAPDYNQQHMRSYNIHIVTALTPTMYWRAVGGWDEGIDAWEDWAGHLRLAIRGICGARLPIPTVVYRVYEGDRMVRFYNGDGTLMEKVKSRPEYAPYVTGAKKMASCCGGDGQLAQAAYSAVKNLPGPEPRRMGDDMIRIEYLGPERGAIPFEPSQGRVIRLGNNAMNRFADVTPAEAEWIGQRANIRIVPTFDTPDAPPPIAFSHPPQAITPEAPAVALVPETEEATEEKIPPVGAPLVGARKVRA